MSDAMQSHLERFPEGAIEVAQGRILDFNRAAQAQFPELAVGMEAPEFLSGSLSDPEGAGTFAHNGSLYLFSRVSGAERDLLLFRPAPQSPLTQGQLDGFVRQMRGFLQDLLLEFETVSGPSRGGMDAFSSQTAWYAYKYAVSIDCIPYLCQSVANIIKSLLGKNKKLVACDLDNTLWGGIIGDDGTEGIVMGNETPTGMAYTEFQSYLKELSAMGYDYVALGHIHKPQALEENRMVYAGALEPTDTGDLGPHGYVAGELTEEGCQTRFVPVALREYRELSVQADPAMTGYQVKEKIREAIEEGGTEHMYLVQISGYRDPEIRFDLSGMDVYGNIVEIADETRPSYAFERLLEQNRENFLGSYIESFLGAEEDSAEYQALCEGVCALMETRAD